MPTPIDKKQRPMLYRYVTDTTSSGVMIVCKPYIAIAETKCYYWAVDNHASEWSIERFLLEMERGEKPTRTAFGLRVRKVHKNAARSYCNADRWKAWLSFQRRQESRLRKIRWQESEVLAAIDYFRKGNENNPPTAERLPLGHNEFTRGLSWEDPDREW